MTPKEQNPETSFIREKLGKSAMQSFDLPAKLGNTSFEQMILLVGVKSPIALLCHSTAKPFTSQGKLSLIDLLEVSDCYSTCTSCRHSSRPLVCHVSIW